MTIEKYIKIEADNASTTIEDMKMRFMLAGIINKRRMKMIEPADPLIEMMLSNIQYELIENDATKKRLLKLRSEILNNVLDGSAICNKVNISAKVEMKQND
jgi:hypothetical protein